MPSPRNSAERAGHDSTGQQRRPYIGVTFACCGVYTRIYINRNRTAYFGYCPKCAAPIRIKAGPGGSKERFWVAD